MTPPGLASPAVPGGVPPEGAGREDLWRVVEGYVTRWRVEEAIRYIKQS